MMHDDGDAEPRNLSGTDEINDSDMDDDSNYDDAEFVDLCRSLRRNDPHTTTVDFVLSPTFGCIHRLGPSIVNNTVVTQLTLNLSCLCTEKEEIVTSGIDDIAHFIKTSNTLREVRFKLDGAYQEFSGNEERIAGQLIRAVACSKSIETLVCGCLVEIPAQDFTHFLETTTTVTELTNDSSVVTWPDEDEERMIQEAFRRNTSLKILSIAIDSEQLELLEHILIGVASHPTLEEIQLEADCHGPENLVQVVVVADLCSNLSIRVLKLTSYCFNATNLACLFNAFGATSNVTTLVFCNCSFDVDATKLFIKFMKLGLEATRIRELRLLIDKLHSEPFEDTPISRVLANMLMGSPLQTLELNATTAQRYPSHETHRLQDIECLLCAMVKYPNGIKLPNLRLMGVAAPDMNKVARFLPRLRHLRQLTIRVKEWNDVNPERIQRALRRNSSLHHVDISFVHGAAFFGESLNRLVEAYCGRNQNLQVLLANPYVGHGRSTISNGQTCLELFPNLFVVGSETQQTFCNNLLTGILACGTSCGPLDERSAKRIAQG